MEEIDTYRSTIGNNGSSGDVGFAHREEGLGNCVATTVARIDNHGIRQSLGWRKRRATVGDGRVERFPKSPYIEPALDPGTGVGAKDVVISLEPSIKARVFMPRRKAPSSSPLPRLAPENPLPIPYENSWASMQWVAAHFSGEGPEPWGQPKSKSKITHLVFYTTSDVDMLGADYQLTKLLGLPPLSRG
ncbi:hypothetical protein RJ639_018778 [Escallonia herrerae]|uniref:Chalcone/stilbene synthase N-terminal domain-containing protein n=1 Tax=Escallonia herrerae TaxID=1293975 RepID=A0AA88V9L5_9ASTE|nr:hypothetical protein RJ639_018778 [Escallonia herrerae]